MNTTPRPLSDFFTTVRPYNKDNEPAPRLWECESVTVAGVTTKAYTVRVGPYCMIHDHATTPNVYRPSLGVVPSDEVMELIDKSMLALEYDTISFDLIRPNGAADFTLYAKYNLILGSRIIGYVRADTIPQNK